MNGQLFSTSKFLALERLEQLLQVNQAKESTETGKWSPLIKLAQSLQRWTEPIVLMWRFSKNNAITEGFHRKMKLIKRRAYGSKNFNNYRLRVIAQCG